MIDDRMSRYPGMIERTVPLIGKRWTNEWFPLIKQRNEAERHVDYDEMSDEMLFARYHEMTGGWSRCGTSTATSTSP